MIFTPKMYKSDVKPTWCPGCGDYGLLSGMQKAMAKLQLHPKDTVIVSGIGCSSNFPHFMNTYGVHSIHGRALPVAMGVKLANHELNVIVTGGDGDGYGIGSGHFVHACRRNVNLTYFVMDNSIYGLTTGQASPTTQEGSVTKSTPLGYELHEMPMNPISLALGAGASFVARVFSGDTAHMVDVIAEAIEHRGFAFVDVLSPCVTWQKQATFEYYRERVYHLTEDNHDPTNFMEAMKKAREQGKYGIGVIYKEERPLYEDGEPAYKNGPLVKQRKRLRNNDPILDQFR